MSLGYHQNMRYHGISKCFLSLWEMGKKCFAASWVEWYGYSMVGCNDIWKILSHLGSVNQINILIYSSLYEHLFYLLYNLRIILLHLKSYKLENKLVIVTTYFNYLLLNFVSKINLLSTFYLYFIHWSKNIVFHLLV